MERYLNIGKTSLRFNLYPHLILSILFLSISPLLFGVANLDAARTALLLEMYIALLGIILLTPIFLPEQNKDIRDLVGSKHTSTTTVYLIRLFEAGLSLVLLIGIYILILKYNNCTFPMLKYYLGTLAEAFFLGGMGLCVYSIFDHIAIAYMLPMFYYMISFGGGSKLLKNFHLFTMISKGYTEKFYLAITGLILIVIGISYQRLARKINIIRN